MRFSRRAIEETTQDPKFLDELYRGLRRRTGVEPFAPSRLGWCPASGRLDHALDGRLGPWGLLGSHVAHQLSASLEVDGDDVRLRWRGDVYAVPCVEFRELP